jgi:IS30 family transposase
MGALYTHLTMDERNTIYRRRLEGASLQAIARRLNYRPRKVLGFKTPAEVF